MLDPFGGDGNQIIAYEPIGDKEVYDFTVPATSNYINCGSVHHNTVAGAFETTCHAIGEYPDWWVGRRFEGPTDGWCAGDTNETTRNIIQMALLGPFLDFGTGMIPHRCVIGEPTRRQGLAEAVDTIRVQHSSGGISQIGLKAYEAGRAKFQGTSKHYCWIDEEPPEDVYDEILLRLMTLDGLLMATFTPMKGLSAIALRYLPHLAPAEFEEDLHNMAPEPETV